MGFSSLSLLCEFSLMHNHVHQNLNSGAQNLGHFKHQSVKDSDIEACVFASVSLFIELEFFSRPTPKAGHELQTELNTRRRIMNDGPSAEPETVTGP